MQHEWGTYGYMPEWGPPAGTHPAEHPQPWAMSTGMTSSSTRHPGHLVQQRLRGYRDVQSQSAWPQCSTSQQQHFNLKQTLYLQHCTHRLHPRLLQINVNIQMFLCFLKARGAFRSSKLSFCIEQAEELHPATVMRSLITCAGQLSCHSFSAVLLQVTKDEILLCKLQQLESASQHCSADSL